MDGWMEDGMAAAKVDEAELLAAIDALRDVGAEQQEAAILALDQEHPGIGNRAKALLAIEEQAAEDIRKAEEQGKRIVAEAAKAERECRTVKAAVAGIKITVPTPEQEKGRIVELAEIFQNDNSLERIRYDTRKAEVAAELGKSVMDVHRTVQKYIKEQKQEKKDLTHPQKLVSLVLDASNIELWVDPSDHAPYMSVIVSKHCENFRVGDSGFESWVRREYGRRHWTEIEKDGAMRRVPLVMSSATFSEGVATMKALAAASGKEMVPALRVGGAPDEVWLDLGDRDWNLIQPGFPG